MSTLIELINNIEKIDGLVSAIITGVFTFLITKYSYHKNIPLDKMELTYNRLYYPIYCLVCNSEDNSQVIEKSEDYLNKYKKYVDRSTMVAFRFLKNNPKDDKAYKNYRDNIWEINGKLRRRLGYLEPNIFSLYTYSAPSEKRLLRIALEIIVMYAAVFIFTMTDLENLQTVMMAVAVISIFVLMFEIGVIICGIVKNVFKIVYEKIREKLKKK